MPEYFDDESWVGIEAEFHLGLPADTVAKGEWIYNWATYPSSEEVYDSTTDTWTTETTNYSLACAIRAGGDYAMVMNFEGSGDLRWESQANYYSTILD